MRLAALDRRQEKHFTVRPNRFDEWVLEYLAVDGYGHPQTQTFADAGEQGIQIVEQLADITSRNLMFGDTAGEGAGYLMR